MTISSHNEKIIITITRVFNEFGVLNQEGPDGLINNLAAKLQISQVKIPSENIHSCNQHIMAKKLYILPILEEFFGNLGIPNADGVQGEGGLIDVLIKKLPVEFR